MDPRLKDLKKNNTRNSQVFMFESVCVAGLGTILTVTMHMNT